MNRRVFVAAGAATAFSQLTSRRSELAAAARGSSAGGPPVFLSYDQAELDALYNQDLWAPNVQQVRARWASNSAAARARLGPPLHVAYGPSAIETLDIYRTSRPDAPIHVFIHGGAWQRGSAADSAFAAELVTRAGAHFVVPDFARVQDVGGSLLEMARQVRRAVAWTYRNASSFAGDARRLYISGHSSGAHLAAIALTTDWTADGLPRDLLKGGVCCSGIFDLKAPRLSSRREYVAFDDATEDALSPIRHVADLRAPVAIACGSLDNVEFQRQSRAFVDALSERGHAVQHVVGDQYTHFELVETMASPYGVVGRLVLEQMNLSVAAD
jgi:arylformamidase